MNDYEARWHILASRAVSSHHSLSTLLQGGYKTRVAFLSAISLLGTMSSRIYDVLLFSPPHA